jgi:hypothetical protein
MRTNLAGQEQSYLNITSICLLEAISKMGLEIQYDKIHPGLQARAAIGEWMII